MNKDAILNALPYRNQVVLISRKQTIKDIAKEVLAAHEYYSQDYDRIAQFFNNRDLLKTFKELYFFCKTNVPYNEEKESKQTTKSPAWIIREAIGDCKHYASFIGGVLGSLQRSGRVFNWWFAFASYEQSEKLPGHVFVVAEWNNERYWIDPVLSSFDNRLQPSHLYLIKPKPKNMALYRMGAVNDSLPVASTAIENIEGELSMPNELKRAIELLLQYKIVNAQGQMNDARLIALSKTLPDVTVRELAAARLALHSAATIGGLFDDVAFAVKQVALALPRNAFLGLVAINAFGLATKLKNAVWQKDKPMENEFFTPFQDTLYKRWHSLGGLWGNLRDTIKKGSEKRAILGATMGEPVSIATITAAAAAIIAAIMPLVNAFLNKARQDQVPTINWNDPNNFTGVPGANGGGGITAFIEKNPIVVAGLAAGVVWYFTRKKR